MEEDGNNVNSNFSVRATKNHMDLSEEHAKGHFYVRSVLGQLDCNFVWNHYINISSFWAGKCEPTVQDTREKWTLVHTVTGNIPAGHVWNSKTKTKNLMMIF